MGEHAKMKGNIILLGLCVSFLIICVSAANCDQKQIEYYINTSQFDNAAVCSYATEDYDHAIEYYTKAIKQSEENNQSTALKYILLAKSYSKKGSGFEDKIREQCTMGEKLLLNEISHQLERSNPLYGSIQSDYRSLADCYYLIDDKEKTCGYCSKCNEYGAKARYKIVDCPGLFGCPITPKTVNSDSGTDVAGGNASGLPLLPIGVGIVVLLLIGGFFLIKRKKK
jgi:LPXTG-motif cell wall-anchored protein